VALKFSLSLAKLPPGEYNCQITVLNPASQKAAFWQAPVMLVQQASFVNRLGMGVAERSSLATARSRGVYRTADPIRTAGDRCPRLTAVTTFMNTTSGNEFEPVVTNQDR
jgi:hypothetical protein